MDVKYTNVDMVELEPNCYSGPDGDQIKKQWKIKDRCGNEFENQLILEASNFPPGTRVIIEVPNCPKCDQPAEDALEGIPDCECGFSWENWVFNEYS